MSAIEAGRPYMSIGEVLNVLKDEFPDVTVSKIRFLESEGLIQPERTSSGYRKFSPLDVERLTFILRQQRDHFLPLKVIRERLAEWEARGGAGEHRPSGAEPRPEPQHAAPVEEFLHAPTGVSMSRAELHRACGLEETEIDNLQSFGLITARESHGGEPRYNEVDLEVARLARDLLKLGLEPRHLRMFKTTSDRWTALAEQMVLPLVKQRNPEARRVAAETVHELVRIGNRLMQALLRDGLRTYAP